MRLFCKHKWEVLSETTTESMNEQSQRLTGAGYDTKNILGLRELSAKKHILVVKCDRCGKIKRFVENI